MSRIAKYRENVHQPYYDHFVRGIGQTSLNNQFQLFGSANIGNPEMTNLAVAGVLASGQALLMKAIRCSMYFQSLNDPEFNVAFGDIAAITHCTGTQARAQDLYSLLAYGGLFTLNVGLKPMLTGPLWYVPAGGGVAGTSTVSDRHALQNGMPTQQAILKLAKPVAILPTQNFNCQLNFFPYAIKGAGQDGTNPERTVDPLLALNEFDGIKQLGMYVDGINTRDVQ